MPLGYERINEKRSSPNKNIVFIKPRSGPDEATSKDFLERIAAQCLPIMNKHRLAVASLEEYEPNLEFWGRNFNAGEVIQLVLKSPTTGRWLPLKFVQMVMMHELAHIHQMNHSAAFWKLRNEYSKEMKALWDNGYTGDGLWGRGILLENGAFAQEDLGEGEVLPVNMCGGTFNSRGRRKRKMKPKITYKESQERRIKKKFGINGMALGADDEVKAKLEKGKKPAGKPRVAGSARGRELRAAAALARFEAKKENPEIKDEDLVTDSGTESDEDDVFVKTESDDAVDINGKKLLDAEGRSMVKVCECEDKDGSNAQRELFELQNIHGNVCQSASSKPSRQAKSSTAVSDGAKRTWYFKPVGDKKSAIKKEPNDEIDSSTANEASDEENNKDSKVVVKQAQTLKPDKEEGTSAIKKKDDTELKNVTKPQPNIAEGSCPICSVVSDVTALTCAVCSNVLRPEFVVNAWRCQSSLCKDSSFVNAGDYGVCQVCGARKIS